MSAKNSKLSLLVLFLCFLSSVARADLYQGSHHTDWASFRDLTTDEYVDKLNEYKALGYRPFDVEIKGGLSKRYSIIFNKSADNRAWGIHTTLTHNEFADKWAQYKNDGYIPVDIETYRTGGDNYYGGIWVKNKENRLWHSYRNQTGDDFHEKFLEMKAQGFRPIDLDGAYLGTKLRFSSIWVRNTEQFEWAVRRNVSSSDFGAEFDQYIAQGFKPYKISGYNNGFTTYFATIWIKEGNDQRALKRDLTDNEFHNHWLDYRDRGFRLVSVASYSTAFGTRYAGIWRENLPERIDWSKRSTIDSLASQYHLDTNAAGTSYAIIHKGVLRYLRGFGEADKWNNKRAHGNTVYRLASVSKAVTGTLGFVLEDKGSINLSNKTRSILTSLPSHHKNHLLEQLLSNRSKIRHYKSNDPVSFLGNVSDAWEAVESFMDDPLVSEDYLYSTHAYTVFAAALEKKTGKTFCSLLKTAIATPQNLKLRCENRDLDDSDRSKVYSVFAGASVPAIADNLSWKYAGGGMESSALDLASFGQALLEGKIMSRTRVTKMTTKPDNLKNYAYGWDTGTHAGHAYYAKGGAQTGANSYIRIYPNQDLIIVILSNTRGDGIINATKEMALEILP